MATDTALLEARWNELTVTIPAPPAVRKSLIAEIVRAYQGEGRHYHGVAHVASLLTLSAEHAPLLADRDTIDLAIFFHDVIYSATGSDNEEESAHFAGQAMVRLGFPASMTDKVEGYILATRHGSCPRAPAETDLAYFLDFDLSILGADREAYTAYAAAIRQEYAIYPDLIYCPGRAGVLRKFLAQPRIFATEIGYGRWEARARENMIWEIGNLL